MPIDQSASPAPTKLDTVAYSPTSSPLRPPVSPITPTPAFALLSSSTAQSDLKQPAATALDTQVQPQLPIISFLPTINSGRSAGNRTDTVAQAAQSQQQVHPDLRQQFQQSTPLPLTISTSAKQIPASLLSSQSITTAQNAFQQSSAYTSMTGTATTPIFTTTPASYFPTQLPNQPYTFPPVSHSQAQQQQQPIFISHNDPSVQPQPHSSPDLSDNTDAAALRAAISILQLQRDKSRRDIATLREIKDLASENPDQFLKNLLAGKLKQEQEPAADPLRATFEGPELSDGDEEDEMLGNTPCGIGGAAPAPARKDSGNFPKLPTAQNVVRCPPVNWAKYHIVGAPLDRMHDEQRRRPTAGEPTWGPGRSDTKALNGGTASVAQQSQTPATVKEEFYTTATAATGVGLHGIDAGDGVSTVPRAAAKGLVSAPVSAARAAPTIVASRRANEETLNPTQSQSQTSQRRDQHVVLAPYSPFLDKLD